MPSRDLPGEIRVRFVLDTEDLRRLLNQGVPVGKGTGKPGGPATSSGSAPGPAPGGGPPSKPPGPTKPVKVEAGMSFVSMLKPAAALMGINAGVQGILKQSTITSTYLGSMGKTFAAALDILMAPFTPIFNLLLVLMMKLYEPLRGFADWIGSWTSPLSKGNIGGFIKNFFGAETPAYPMLGMAAGMMAGQMGLGYGARLLAGRGGALGAVGMSMKGLKPLIGRLGLGAGIAGVGALTTHEAESPALKVGGILAGAGGGALAGSVLGPWGTLGGGIIGAGAAGIPWLVDELTKEHSPALIDEIAAQRVMNSRWFNPPGGRESVSGGQTVVVNQNLNWTLESGERSRPEEYAPYMERAGRSMAIKKALR